MPHERTAMIVVLAGGVGAARFLQGLVTVVDPREIIIISNVGDDCEIYGVRVCPDTDIVTYTLAGIVDEDLGFGIAGDTFHVLEGLGRLGVDTWFRLGDRDFATAASRTARLDEGTPLHRIAADIARALNVRSTIIPATDAPLRTRVRTAAGEWLDFQEYFVHRRNEPEVVEIEYRGAGAPPAPGVLAAIKAAELILVAPSNPFLSIRPILAVAGVEEALRNASVPVVAVSPIVGGRALKGPADRMMKSLGYTPTAGAIPEIYDGLLHGFVYDVRDAPLALELPSLATDTIMSDAAARSRLARECLEFGRSLR